MKFTDIMPKIVIVADRQKSLFPWQKRCLHNFWKSGIYSIKSSSDQTALMQSLEDLDNDQFTEEELAKIEELYSVIENLVFD